MNWELRDPWLLFAILLAPLAYLLARRISSSLQFSSLATADQSPRSWRVRLVILPPLLNAAAVALLAFALAGPRTPDEQTKVYRQGIAIMMAIDRSGSMQARDLVRNDVAVNRLEVVKQVFEQFVFGDGDSGNGRPDDLIGLVTFAAYADSLCPLTLDHGNLVSMSKETEIATTPEEDGTAIGEGLALAVERLRRHPAKSKVAILLTDGVNNAGAIQPMQAAELAAEHNVRVYCIGTGTNGVAPFPARDMFGRTVMQAIRVEIDEKTLQEVATKTGGQYFRATDIDTLERIYTEIGQLERTKISDVRYLEYTEHYGTFVGTALSLVTVAAIANRSILRQLP